LLGKQPERFDEHIKVMESVSESMRSLVEDLLDVSRFERGIITLEREPIILQNLIREVVNVLSSNSEYKKINLSCELPEVPLVVAIDARRMRQVLTNLIMNALHYTPSGGTIMVKLDQVAGQDQDYAIIKVQDSGIGIAPEILPRIFEPFFRASEGGAGGTGLGLTISREIVELHDGTISVESQLGEGSTFSVQFPITVIPSE
jgi:signal transduction histidine kinase